MTKMIGNKIINRWVAFMISIQGGLMMKKMDKLETLNAYFGKKMSAKQTDLFYKQLTKDPLFQQEFIEAGALLKDCETMQWAEISRTDARKFIESIQGKSKTRQVIQWIKENWPLLPDSPLQKQPSLVPVVDQLRRFRRDVSNFHSLAYIIHLIKGDGIRATLFFEQEQDTFCLNVIHVKADNLDNPIRFSLFYEDRLIISRPYSNQGIHLKAYLSFGTYHLVIKKNAQEVCHFSFDMNQSGLSYEKE